MPSTQDRRRRAGAFQRGAQTFVSMFACPDARAAGMPIGEPTSNSENVLLWLMTRAQKASRDWTPGISLSQVAPVPRVDSRGHEGAGVRRPGVASRGGTPPDRHSDRRPAGGSLVDRPSTRVPGAEAPDLRRTSSRCCSSCRRCRWWCRPARSHRRCRSRWCRRCSRGCSWRCPCTAASIPRQCR